MNAALPERHTKEPILVKGAGKSLVCYYAKQKAGGPMQRRAFWMTGNTDLVLLQYKLCNPSVPRGLGVPLPERPTVLTPQSSVEPPARKRTLQPPTAPARKRILVQPPTAPARKRTAWLPVLEPIAECGQRILMLPSLALLLKGRRNLPFTVVALDLAPPAAAPPQPPAPAPPAAPPQPPAPPAAAPAQEPEDSSPLDMLARVAATLC